MIHLISIANPRLAQAFIDYMAMQNIVIEMRAEPQGKFLISGYMMKISSIKCSKN